MATETDDEIAARYLAQAARGPAGPDTTSEEDEIAQRYLAAASVGAEKPEPALPKEPGFVEKSMDRLQLGLSDAMSTMAGDTYGRGTADALEKTPVNKAWRPFSAVASTLEGIGDVTGEAIMAGDKAIGSPLSKSMAALGGSAYGQTAGWGASKVEEGLEATVPELMPALGEAATIAGAVLPYAKGLKAGGGAKVAEGLKQSKVKLREGDIAKRWEPESPVGEPGSVDENMFGFRKVNPPEYRAQMYEDIASVEGLNPRKSKLSNFNALDDSVEVMRKKLDADLKPYDALATDDVKIALNEAIESASLTPTLAKADVAKVADSVFVKFEELVSKHTVDGKIKPGDLLQARRDLDTWLRKNKTNIFDSETMSGQTIAVNSIRNTINEQVAKAAPDAKVAESLRKQSSLLTARDEMVKGANVEGKNPLSRAIREVQDITGMTPVHTPNAVGASLQPGALAVGATGAALGLGRRPLGNALRRIGAEGMAAPSSVYNVSRGPLVLAAAARKEEENK